jgi:hypothetical protein
MDQQKRTFVQETMDFVAIAKWNRKRIAFWGWDADVISALKREKLIEDIETIFITEDYPVQDIEACKITQAYHDVDQIYQAPEKLVDFKPDKLCILHYNPYRAIRVYEMLLRQYKQNPMDIYGTSSMWRISDYIEDDTYNKLVASIPKAIVGGLIPKSRLSVYNGLRYIVKNQVPGRILNFGVSRGWSMYFIAQTLSQLGDTDRRIVGFDSFSGFPQEASPLDLCHLKYKKYAPMYTPEKKELFQRITEKNLEPHMHRISLVAGDINETITLLGDEPIALALFDMDDYTPTQVSLEPTYEWLSTNGIFILDHFTHDTIGGFCIGQRIAMLEFLEKHPMLGFTESNMFFKTEG